MMSGRIKFTAALVFSIAAMFTRCDDNLLDVTRESLLDTDKAITSFSFDVPPACYGVINEEDHTINVIVPYGTDTSVLIPTITHTGVSISPGSGLAPDFSAGPVIYTVTAENGSTRVYTVTVTTAASPAKAITAFSFAVPIAEGVIYEEEYTILVFVPYGTDDLTALVPTIVHTGISISPESGVATDFSAPVVYTVTAEDFSSRNYTVTVFEDEDNFWAFAVSDSGQIGCWNVSGQPMSCSGSGQDGAYVNIPNERSFTANGNNTVTDDVTDLIWTKCSLKTLSPTVGMDITGDCSDTHGTGTWQEAIDACASLDYAGRTDWRLPSIEELNSIPDYEVCNPVIDTVYFPNTEISAYWSSSTDVEGTDEAWIVNFFYGDVEDAGKSASSYVRCVAGP